MPTFVCSTLHQIGKIRGYLRIIERIEPDLEYGEWVDVPFRLSDSLHEGRSYLPAPSITLFHLSLILLFDVKQPKENGGSFF
jgi:hypothetical protein